MHICNHLAEFTFLENLDCVIKYEVSLKVSWLDFNAVVLRAGASRGEESTEIINDSADAFAVEWSVRRWRKQGLGSLSLRGLFCTYLFAL